MKHLIVPLAATLIASQLQAATQMPSQLRGGIETTQATIAKALAMKKQGWEYVMPKPKSPQAAWGNPDRRTTWWNGYWINRNSNQYSSKEPVLKDGKYVGDGVNVTGERRGGSPNRLRSEMAGSFTTW
jgi:hypothetical protein